MEVSTTASPLPVPSGVILSTCVRRFKIMSISLHPLTPVVYSSHGSQSDLFEKRAANHIIPCSDFQRASIILIVKALFCTCESPAHLPYLSSITAVSLVCPLRPCAVLQTGQAHPCLEARGCCPCPHLFSPQESWRLFLQLRALLSLLPVKVLTQNFGSPEILPCIYLWFLSPKMAPQSRALLVSSQCL